MYLLCTLRFESAIHVPMSKKKVEKKITEITGGKLCGHMVKGAGFETHTHSSQQQSQVKLLGNLLITDWFTSCQLGLSMIELSLPYR